MRFALVLLGVVFLTLPIAAAHAIPADLIVEPFSAPLPFADAGEPARTVVHFDYRCSGLSRNATEPNMSVHLQPVAVPAGLALQIEPADIDLPECEGIGRVSATLFGSVSRNASAASTGAVQILARWRTSGAELDTTAAADIIVPWISRLRIDAPVTEITDRPQTPVVFPVTLTNEGNDLTRVSFEVLSKSENLLIPVPNPIVLQAGPGQQRTAQVPFVVQTPYHNGRVNEEGTVTFRIETSPPLDPATKGEPQDITFTVRTQGWYVPGPQAFGAMAAVGLAAVLLARRRG